MFVHASAELLSRDILKFFEKFVQYVAARLILSEVKLGSIAGGENDDFPVA